MNMRQILTLLDRAEQTVRQLRREVEALEALYGITPPTNTHPDTQPSRKKVR
ncbi:MAG: hypothetical protein ACRCYU_15950 [Nocardioides sp.]